MVLYYLLKKILFKRISNLRIQFIFQYLLTRINWSVDNPEVSFKQQNAKYCPNKNTNSSVKIICR